MVDRFFRLGHNAIISGDNKDNDVGNFGAARTHASERFVARRIDEHNGAFVDLHFVRANVLRDAARFATGHIRFANRIEQTRFAMIDVTHDGNDRRTRFEILFRLFLRNFENHFLFEGDDANDSVKGFRKLRRGWNIQSLVDAREDALIEQDFQKFFCAHIQFFREFANCNPFGNRNVAWRARLRRSNNGSGSAAIAA